MVPPETTPSAGERLAAVLAASPAGIVEIDRRGEIRTANAAAVALLAGMSTAGEPFELPAALAPVVLDLVVRAHATNAVAQADVVVRDATRGSVDVTVTVAGIDEGGAMAILTDVTRRNELERDHVAASVQAAVLDGARRIAHDFGNLLTRIVGYTELARRLVENGEHPIDELAEISAAAEEAVRLTREVAPGPRVEVTPPVGGANTDVGAVVIEIAPTLSTLAGGASHLVVHAGGPTRVALDRSSLEHILRNLVVNAGDALTGAPDPRAGRVEVTVGPSERPEGHTVITVADNGAGMEPAVLAQCLEDGFTTRRDTGGTGMGLAMVDRLVRSAGGLLDIESEVGRGTTITVRLPPPAPIGDHPQLP